MNIDLKKYSVEELVKLRDEIDNHIYSYKDGFVYICNVRSYGRVFEEYGITNEYTLQELCFNYDGEDGIVDVYSTNPNLSHIHNYGGMWYIESEHDYRRWKEYSDLKGIISDSIKILEKWENRDNLPFTSRPLFPPSINRGEVNELKLEFENFKMDFIPPVKYKKSDSVEED